MQKQKDRAVLYHEFLETSRGDINQKSKAYLLARDYLELYETADTQTATSIRAWMLGYQNEIQKHKVDALLIARDFKKLFETGRQLLETEADNLHVLSLLITGAQMAAELGKLEFRNEGLACAQRALLLLQDQQGDVDKSGYFKNKEEAKGFYLYVSGSLLKDSLPIKATTFFFMCAQTNSVYRQDPKTYLYLGACIYNGEYASLLQEYNQRYGGKEASTTSTALLQQVNASIDRMIDAFARSVALSKNEDVSFKSRLMEQLRVLYLARNNHSDKGFNEMLAAILAKPMMKQFAAEQ